jgi:hypothetical protein
MRAAALCVLLAACATPEPFDYTAFLAHPPRSILVLPPLNESPDPEGPYVFLSTVTRPLAERGYYVFPVAVVEQMMRENGLPTPWEMHQVELAKFAEVFGADAVLYPTIEEWGTSYQLINSQSRVAVRYRLVDVASGIEIWSGSGVAEYDSSSGSSSLLGMMVGAVLNQVTTELYDESYGLSEQANSEAFGSTNFGLLPGPYYPVDK